MLTITTITLFASLLINICSAMDYTNKICFNDNWSQPKHEYSFDHWDLNDKPVYRHYTANYEAYNQIDFTTDNYDRTANNGNKWGETTRNWGYVEGVDRYLTEGTLHEDLRYWCVDKSQPETFLDCDELMFRRYPDGPVINIDDKEGGYYWSDCGNDKINTDDILVNIVIRECWWAHTNVGVIRNYYITNLNTCSEAAKIFCTGKTDCVFTVTPSNSPECLSYTREEINNYTWECTMDREFL